MSYGQKRPFARTINEFVNSNIKTANNGLGQILPCRVTEVNGAIVTVNFEIKAGNQTFAPVTCPIAESTYVRIPVQVGDFGICISADVRLGGISGLGQGKAPLGKPSNLGGLVFVPIGNKNWESVDPNAVNINAPNGAVIRDTTNTSYVKVTPQQLDIHSPIVNISGVASATISATGIATLNAKGLAVISAPAVMLGQAPYGDLANLPDGAGTLFESTIADGASAIYSNPISNVTDTLISACGDLPSQINDLVTSGIITSADALGINESISSLSGTATNMLSHSNLLSGLGSITGNVPNLNSIIGMAQGADFSAGGAFGDTSSLITGMTTSLTSSPLLTSSTDYLNTIVGGLTDGSLTPSAVISQNGINASSITSYINVDTSAYTTLQSNLTSTSTFLNAVSQAQTTNTGISSYISQVIPSGNLNILKTVGI